VVSLLFHPVIVTIVAINAPKRKTVVSLLFHPVIVTLIAIHALLGDGNFVLQTPLSVILDPIQCNFKQLMPIEINYSRRPPQFNQHVQKVELISNSAHAPPRNELQAISYA
jgi:hypothetical protein